MSKFEELNDRVIAFVSDGSYGLTDFVTRTASEFGVTKSHVRGLVLHYDKNPGSPAGRPAAGSTGLESGPETQPEVALHVADIDEEGVDVEA